MARVLSGRLVASRNQIARFMGPDMTMAGGQMVDNFSTAAIATFLCATLFLALPRILEWRRGHVAVLTLAFFMTGNSC